MSSVRRCTSEKGFEQDLSDKQKFFLYLSIVIPNIELIRIIWEIYKKDIDETILRYYNQISPFQAHPCGNDNLFNALFHPIGGFIDAEIFDLYYEPRENYLRSIVMIGHPWFLCKFFRTKEEIEMTGGYFERLINEAQMKLTPLRKAGVLELAIHKLLHTDLDLTYDSVMKYLYTIYAMYNEVKILSATPIAIDSEGKLCRFE